jgi:phage baseplate assembly protein W
MVLNPTSTLYGKGNPKPSSFLTKRKSEKFYGFKFPFGNLSDGGFLKKASDLELIKSGIRQLLLTHRGERVMLPNYGTNLRKYLMEPLDQATLSQIRREILESFSKYARDVNLLKIQIIPGDTQTLSGGHHLYVRLYCSLKEQEGISFEVNVDII